jgi:cell pole-organizing protein PopZ
MFPAHWRHRIAFAPSDDPSGAPAGADAPADGAPAAEPAGGGGLFDLVEQTDTAPKTGEDGKPQRPEGVPEQFWDPDKQSIRADSLLKSWRDLRAKVSQRGAGEAPPEKPDAYAPPKVEGLPDGFIGGERDTLWPTIQQAAHKAGVSQKQLDALAGPFLASVAEQIRAQAPPDAETQAAAEAEAAQAELAKLGPNARAFVSDIGGWLKGMASRGMFTAEEAAALRQVSTAAGMRALGKLRELTGEQPIPTDAIQAEAATVQDLQRQMTEGYRKGDQAAVDRARRALEEMERKGLLPAA